MYYTLVTHPRSIAAALLQLGQAYAAVDVDQATANISTATIKATLGPHRGKSVNLILFNAERHYSNIQQ